MATITRTNGLIFPLVLTSGKHTISETEDLIESSIKVILSWPIYTREFVDDFGSRLLGVLEEPNDDILMTLIRRFIIDSLGKWEKRIELIDLNIYRPTYEKIVIDATYKIIELNIEDTTRYEFYTN